MGMTEVKNQSVGYEEVDSTTRFEEHVRDVKTKTIRMAAVMLLASFLACAIFFGIMYPSIKIRN